MKYLLVLALIINIASGALLTDEETVKLNKYSDTCVAQTHISESVLEKLRMNQIEDDPLLKEYLFCIFQALGFENSDGTILKQNILFFTSRDPVAEIAMKPCIDKHGSTGAESVFALYKCYILNLPTGFKTTL